MAHDLSSEPRRPATSFTAHARAVPAAVAYHRDRRSELTRRLHHGELVRVRPGVYLPTPRGAGSALQREADVLAPVRGVIERFTTPYWFSHLTAALLWGCWTWRLPPDVHITQLANPTIRREEVYLRRHWTTLPLRDRASIGGIAVVSLERTVVDCARMLPTSSALVIADSALRLGADATVIADVLGESVGKRGVRRARDVLALADARSESPGESLLRHAAWSAGLPVPSPQLRVQTAIGDFRLDLGWADVGVGIEFDGAVKYSGGEYGDPAERLWAEKRRHEALVDAGWWVVRVAWSELDDVAALGDKLMRARQSRTHSR